MEPKAHQPRAKEPPIVSRSGQRAECAPRGLLGASQRGALPHKLLPLLLTQIGETGAESPVVFLHTHNSGPEFGAIFATPNRGLAIFASLSISSIGFAVKLLPLLLTQIGETADESPVVFLHTHNSGPEFVASVATPNLGPTIFAGLSNFGCVFFENQRGCKLILVTQN